MGTVLLILGALGLVLMILVLYVFLVAARNFVSDPDVGQELSDSSIGGAQGQATEGRPPERRAGGDRRRHSGKVDFPFVDSFGVLVEQERRHGDRRRYGTPDYAG